MKYLDEMLKNFLFVGLVLSFVACEEDPIIDPIEVSYAKPGVHMVLGNPSNAVAEATSPDNFLVMKDQFAFGYKNSTGTAMWCSWHLAPEWDGNTPRQDDFRPDEDLPNGFFKASSTSYSGTGFDRGHLCPSADRTASVTDNSATFVMTNMLPMAPNVNQDAWADMENYCRTLMNSGYELYIVAGGYGEGGSGSNGGTTKKIANGAIKVPKRLWKIVVAVPLGSDDLDRITEDTRVIAVDVPNMQSAGSTSWGDRRVSVRSIETASGLNFLSNLPADLQEVLENKVDNGPIN